MSGSPAVMIQVMSSTAKALIGIIHKTLYPSGLFLGLLPNIPTNTGMKIYIITKGSG